MINLWLSISHITVLLKVKILVSTEIFHYYTIYRWCHDIGWEHAANRPLLRTIFQVILLTVRQYSFSPMFSHLLSFLSLLRSWCVYSALARRHCYLLSVIKQRFVQFQRLSPVSFSISAVWYFQFVWLFLCSDFFLYLQTPLDYLTQALKEDIEKVVMLYFLLTCFPLCHVAMLINHCLLLSDMGLCSETRSLQGSSA